MELVKRNCGGLGAVIDSIQEQLEGMKVCGAC